MSEQSNFSNHSKRRIDAILMIIGVCLLAAQFLVTVLPGIVQKVTASQTAEDGFAAIGETIDEKIEPVVAQEVAAAKTADAGAEQKPAFGVEMESDVAAEPVVAVEPVFVFEPSTHIQLNVLSAFRIIGGLVAFIFLGVGIYILNTPKKPNKME